MKLPNVLRDLLGIPRRPGGNDFAPRPPGGICVYAVGDIHGQLRELENLLALIEADAEKRRACEGLEPLVVFLGDYVDRGPDSRGVLDRLCALRARAAAVGQGIAARFLIGNHEESLRDFLREPASGAEWLAYGGAETLLSYGVRPALGTTDPARCRTMRDALVAALPDAHRSFLEDLEPMVVLGDYAFVHAGIRPGVSLDRQSLRDLLWIREPFLSSPREHGKVIVHGHTVVDQPEIRPNRIGIDTGAYATGILTGLALHGTARRIIQATARRADGSGVAPH